MSDSNKECGFVELEMVMLPEYSVKEALGKGTFELERVE